MERGRTAWFAIAALVFLLGGTVGAVWLINADQPAADAPEAVPVEEAAAKATPKKPVSVTLPVKITWIYTGSQTRIRVRLDPDQVRDLQEYNRIRVDIPEYEVGHEFDPGKPDAIHHKRFRGSRQMPLERLTIRVFGIGAGGRETLLFEQIP